MTKDIGLPTLTVEELYDNLENSPYYNIAWKYMEKTGVKNPCILDMFVAMHEIAKIDNKINKKKKEYLHG